MGSRLLTIFQIDHAQNVAIRKGRIVSHRSLGEVTFSSKLDDFFSLRQTLSSNLFRTEFRKDDGNFKNKNIPVEVPRQLAGLLRFVNAILLPYEHDFRKAALGFCFLFWFAAFRGRQRGI